MLITINLRDLEDGGVEIDEIRLPYSGETAKSETAVTLLVEELRKLADRLSIQETDKILAVMKGGRFLYCRLEKGGEVTKRG